MPETSVDPRIHDVSMHIPPGRKRAPFFRYIRINLPRLTRAALFAVVALMAAMAAAVASADFDIFAGGHVALWIVAGLAALEAALLAVTPLRVWDFGLVPAAGAVLAYIGGLFGTAPYVGNGAGVYLAAGWNTMLLTAVAYLAFYWAIQYGVLAAYPDDQGFDD